MNKLFIFVGIWMGIILSAQSTQILPHNTGYMPVHSYNGHTVNKLIHIPIHIDKNQGNQMKNWSLSFRVIGTIVNSEGKTFPIDRLSLRFNSVTATSANDAGLYPTAANTNVFTENIPFQPTLSNLVQYSNYDLQIVNRYFSMDLAYNVTVAGGAYLEQYKSWNNYKANLLIELRNANHQLMDSKTVGFDMQVYPTGTPPDAVKNTLIVDGTAKNVLLEFKNPGDYANGVSKTLPRAFSVTSPSGYNVHVQTVHTNLTSISNKTLPVNLIRLTTKDHTTQNVTGSIQLSSNAQNIVTSNQASSTARYFDVIYSTQANENQFFEHSYEQYSGTLIFSLIPL